MHKHTKHKRKHRHTLHMHTRSQLYGVLVHGKLLALAEQLRLQIFLCLLQSCLKSSLPKWQCCLRILLLESLAACLIVLVH
jgi:hypothetical protein